MKQVIILRKDLNMRKGKMVAQGAHASMAVFFNRRYPEWEHDDFIKIRIDEKEWKWINGLFTKVCLGVNSKEELLELYEQAKKLELPCALIEDSGKTEFHGNKTYTAVAIGPAEDNLINNLTGHLKLL